MCEFTIIYTGLDQLERENVKEAYALVAMGPLECPAKAAEFDRQHSGARWGRHHAGAKELALQYTAGEPMCTCTYVGGGPSHAHAIDSVLYIHG